MKIVFISWLINRLSHDSLQPSEPVGENKTKWNLQCGCFRGGLKNIKKGGSRIKRKFRYVRWMFNDCLYLICRVEGERKERYAERICFGGWSDGVCGVGGEAGSSFWNGNVEAEIRLRTEASFHTGSEVDHDYANLDDFTIDELLDWLNTDVGATLIQDSQNEDNIEHGPEYNKENYNVVEQNTNITIHHVSQDELHIANEVYEEKGDSFCQDTLCISSSTTPVVVVDNQRTSKISISLEVLQRHFKMSLADAAKSLDVSVSTLKRICRRNGIQRWPNRCKRKNIIQEQSRDPKNVYKLVKMNDNQSTASRALVVSPLEESSISIRNVTIKATYGDDIVKFPFSVSSGLNDLKEKMCLRLGINIPIKLKCMDDDGDLVLIACDDTLHEHFGNRFSRLVDHNTTFDFSVLRDTNYNV